MNRSRLALAVHASRRCGCSNLKAHEAARFDPQRQRRCWQKLLRRQFRPVSQGQGDCSRDTRNRKAEVFSSWLSFFKPKAMEVNLETYEIKFCVPIRRDR